jgi:hypothetical protein
MGPEEGDKAMSRVLDYLECQAMVNAMGAHSRAQEMIAEACRRWGFSREDAGAWVEAPHRVRAWTYWLGVVGGTPHRFFDEHFRATEVLWTVVSRLEEGRREPGRPLDLAYLAKLYATAFGDASVVLALLYALTIECARYDLIAARSLSGTAVKDLDAALAWTSWYVNLPAPIDILMVYQTIETACATEWGKKDSQER